MKKEAVDNLLKKIFGDVLPEDRGVLARRVESALKALTPKEEQVIIGRFGLLDGEIRTLKALGQRFAVTAERIRQIEAKGLRKLRHPSRWREDE